MRKTINGMSTLNKILITGSVVLLASTVTFLSLYISAHRNYMDSQSFGRTCIKSFVRAVDLTLCEEDLFFGNVKVGACKSYKDATANDMDWVRSMGYDNAYNYIGAN